MQDYERLIAGQDLPEEVVQGVAQSSREASSRARLRTFLAEAHAQMPEVSEEEVDQDIQEAVEAVRKHK